MLQAGGGHDLDSAFHYGGSPHAAAGPARGETREMHTGVAPMAAVATSQRSAIVHPAGAMETFFSRRLAAAHPLRRTCVWIAALGVAYAIAILFRALGGDTPGTAPWLAI